MTDQEIMRACLHHATELSLNMNDLRQRGYEVELTAMQIPSVGETYAEFYTVEAFKRVKLTGDTGES